MFEDDTVQCTLLNELLRIFVLFTLKDPKAGFKNKNSIVFGSSSPTLRLEQFAKEG